MYSVDKCPCCNENKFSIYHSVVAPFISRYVLNNPVSTTKILDCNVCGFRFFQDRFSDIEIKKLYGEYRSHSYYKERNRFEFWYTKSVNQNLGNEPHEILNRNKRTYEFIKKNHPAKFQQILDYGGDRGQFIPGNLSEKAFVFEISDSEVLPGIHSVKDETTLNNHKFDLIFLSHVLEHLSDPAVMIKKLSNYLSVGSHLYLEVPFERYIISSQIQKSSYYFYLKTLIQFPLVLKFVDFVSVILKKKLNIIPLGCFLKLHEHINFFNKSSLDVLLVRNGFRIISIENFKSDSNNVLMCLAVKET